MPVLNSRPSPFAGYVSLCLCRGRHSHSGSQEEAPLSPRDVIACRERCVGGWAAFRGVPSLRPGVLHRRCGRLVQPRRRTLRVSPSPRAAGPHELRSTVAAVRRGLLEGPHRPLAAHPRVAGDVAGTHGHMSSTGDSPPSACQVGMSPRAPRGAQSTGRVRSRRRGRA